MAFATLLILGNSFEPTLATRLLGLRPSQYWRCGERKSFVRKDGTKKYFDSVHEWSGWKRRLSKREEKKELSAEIEQWCRMLMPKKKALAQLRAAGCEIFLDGCLIDKTSQFILPPAILAQLAELDLNLRVTCYAHAS